MKIPQLLKLNPKVNIAVVATAFLAGAALYGVPSSQKPGVHLASDVTVPTSQTTSNTTSTTDPSQLGINTSGTSTATAPSTPTDGTSSSLQPASNGTQTETPQVQDSVVTPISATLGDWTYQGTSNVGVIEGQNGSFYWPQYQYCIYAYSDNSTQQVLYQTRKLWNNGSVTDVTAVSSSCDVSNAPPAN